MAPKSNLAKISYMVDSASEDEMAHDELTALLTPDSAVENQAPTRKPRGKAAQKANAVPATKAAGKGKVATRRVSGSSVLGVKKEKAAVAKRSGAKAGRKVLAEKEHANMSETEEVDEFEGEEEQVKAVEETKPTRRGRPAKAKNGPEDENVAQMHRQQKKTKKTADRQVAAKPAPKSRATKAKAARRAPSPEPEPEAPTIPETQPDPDPMDVEESIEVEEIPESMPPPPAPRPSARRAQQQPQSRSSSTQRQPPIAHRRAGSTSDSERDPAIRRKLGEVTKKLEAMTTKYENLKEVATSGKESNFDQLKRKTEQTAKDQDALIKALNKQVAELQSRSSELSSLKKEVARLQKENAQLSTENKTLTASLTSAQNENKTLSTKLAAARSSAPPETKNAPGSAVKPRSVVLPGSAEAAKEAQIRQLKEDLYSDLTGLIVRGVKKGEEGEDVYDCIQTGRNGTLHFHLSIAQDSDNSYDDTEFIYNALLDENRDKDLLDLLPDYLTEEICFPRCQAAKFYSKVVDCMTKKIVLED
ncbi:hypothetical protein K469DRAFT_713752 [Zopfia rhizophila CBS 207.26]|uniref:Monopolin complex subunit Csm1/Pcs1 C-terminal domain-containing protein n=1 Tax=Zopfia rhizophila CBS 207.26 TaxID=1314779 RepID=A0A6A6DTM7_9PEZI|nr:hypothetical protein K469DRAFT_713752 [Zopfia rhizophila CBS 207.26]